MESQELRYVLALINAEGIGDVIAKKLIAQCGSASNVFSEKKRALLKIPRIGETVVQALQDKTLFERVDQEIEFINAHNIQTVYFKDESLS